ncbi:phage terminase large subunit [soil metagenome]
MTDIFDRVSNLLGSPAPRWARPGALAKELDPNRRDTAALDAIDAALVDVAEGRCKRLMVFCPPQEGKTSLVGRAFPLWLLTHRPELRIVIASYEAEIALRNGRAIRDEITSNSGRDGTLDLGLRIRGSEKAAARWSLDGHEGGVYCVGIGGALSGRPADVLIIDDPVKGREEANSSVYRQRAFDWWQSVARTRLGPDAAVVLVMTRWHASDLAGMLLGDTAEPWRVLSIPAIADSPADTLGRAAGEPLVSARGRTLADWESTQRTVGDYVWSALYQQRPSPLSGGIFKREKVRYWSPMESDFDRARVDLEGATVYLDSCWVFLVADLAASTRTSADYTVIGAFAVTLDQDLILLDLHRERMLPDGHLDAARPMFHRWGAHSLYIESTMQSSTLVYEATRAGIPVSPLTADTDKLTRALPAAARVDQRKLFIPAGAPWATDYLDELAAFPAGAHDDMVDVTAYAARLVAAHYVAPTTESVHRGRERLDPDDPITKAFTGMGTGTVDFFDLPY